MRRFSAYLLGLVILLTIASCKKEDPIRDLGLVGVTYTYIEPTDTGANTTPYDVVKRTVRFDTDRIITEVHYTSSGIDHSRRYEYTATRRADGSILITYKEMGESLVDPMMPNSLNYGIARISSDGSSFTWDGFYTYKRS